MTCRHKPGDPDCSKSGYNSWTPAPITPDSKNYTIERVEFVETASKTALVMQVKYPNCSRCAYEGLKTLVYLGVKMVDALRWREIDPHFADPKLKRTANQAPSPSARYPGNEEGWQDALEYARSKTRAVVRSTEEVMREAGRR